MPPFVLVIICGGSGERLWPLSRAALPKPFVQLPGRAQPLIDDAYTRALGAPLPPPAAVITVTAAEYVFLCEERYRAAVTASIPHTIIAEPMGKNTAPAVAVAAEWCRRQYGDEAIIAVLPSDHIIDNTNVYRQMLTNMLGAAKSGYMSLLGMAPAYPETGFGYIECGEALPEKDCSGSYQVKRFVEKPDRARAQAFMDSGNFLWNGGTFCFTAGNCLREFSRHAPQISAALPPLFSNTESAAATAATTTTADKKTVIFSPPAESYAKFPAISFDYAVMEKTARAAVTRAADFQWRDIGSWRALANTFAPDAQGNRTTASAPSDDTPPAVFLHDCRQTFVAANGGRLVSALGLSDVYILDTPDALLVAAAAQSENVRHIVAQLKTAQREEAVLPHCVRRPWGNYTVLDAAAGYKVKRITVLPQQKLSLQSHQHRSERWTCVSGQMGVVIGEEDFILQIGSSCCIPQGAKHRMYNPTDALAAVIEVQFGGYLGEDDITRYEDIYGRT